MAETTVPTEKARDAAQAVELAVLIDLEARWENLRLPRSRTGEAAPYTVPGLHAKQKAYEAFRARLAGYNRRYRPAHVPEALLNTPHRLVNWCRRTRDVYLRVEGDPMVRCPAHLLEKAYRWADRLAARVGRERLSRPAPPDTVRAVCGGLEAVAVWCEEFATAS